MPQVEKGGRPGSQTMSTLRSMGTGKPVPSCHQVGPQRDQADMEVASSPPCGIPAGAALPGYRACPHCDHVGWNYEQCLQVLGAHTRCPLRSRLPYVIPDLSTPLFDTRYSNHCRLGNGGPEKQRNFAGSKGTCGIQGNSGFSAPAGTRIRTSPSGLPGHCPCGFPGRRVRRSSPAPSRRPGCADPRRPAAHV